MGIIKIIQGTKSNMALTIIRILAAMVITLRDNSSFIKVKSKMSLKVKESITKKREVSFSWRLVLFVISLQGAWGAISLHSALMKIQGCSTASDVGRVGIGSNSKRFCLVTFKTTSLITKAITIKTTRIKLTSSFRVKINPNSLLLFSLQTIQSSLFKKWRLSKTIYLITFTLKWRITWQAQSLPIRDLLQTQPFTSSELAWAKRNFSTSTKNNGKYISACTFLCLENCPPRKPRKNWRPQKLNWRNWASKKLILKKRHCCKCWGFKMMNKNQKETNCTYNSSWSRLKSEL